MEIIEYIDVIGTETIIGVGMFMEMVGKATESIFLMVFLKSMVFQILIDLVFRIKLILYKNRSVYI